MVYFVGFLTTLNATEGISQERMEPSMALFMEAASFQLKTTTSANSASEKSDLSSSKAIRKRKTDRSPEHVNDMDKEYLTRR